MVSQTTNNFSIAITIDGAQYLLEVILPQSIIYDDSNAFYNFRTALYTALMQNNHAIDNTYGYDLKWYLPACWRLTRTVSTNNNKLDFVGLNNWFHGAVGTQDKSDPTTKGLLNIQTHPVGEEVLFQSHMFQIYDNSLFPWVETSNHMNVFTYVKEPPTNTPGWNRLPEPSAYDQIVSPIGSVHTLVSSVVSKTIVGTTVISSPCACGTQDKATIAFKDSCCIDWTTTKDALLNGYNLGVRYAWCGACNEECGAKTHVEMTGSEYLDVFAKTPGGAYSNILAIQLLINNTNCP